MTENDEIDPFDLGAFLAEFKNPQRQAIPTGTVPPQHSKSRTPILDEIGVDLTQKARDGKLDPVIGRDKEIRETIEVLNRRKKNNPVLIGEAGVGKTAIVEGLAQAIVNKSVPEKLLTKKIIKIDPVSLVSGTGMRGQFEARMKGLLKEATENPDVILFIDEIHQIVRAGNAEGGMDAGNILKPALANGEFQLIGATTFDEYRQIESDEALSRRFEKVTVNEPDSEKAFEILKGLKKHYETFHKVEYPDDTLRAAVELSKRYITDRFLPDKAIDLIDQAGAKRNLLFSNRNEETIQQQINNAEAKKQQAIEKEDYEKAGYFKNQQEQFQKELEDFKKAPILKITPVITRNDLAEIIQTQTKIPVSSIKEDELKRLDGLQNVLNTQVIGHTKPIQMIVNAIKRNRIGFSNENRPIGSFLFVGPTGVGKTELAKQLAQAMFGSSKAMIRFDMSEYREEQSISKLIGAPAGYVGYEKAGQLTEKVRRNPYSLILLDEIEKAHPNVLNAFLQVLDDGRLTDSQGHTVDFTNTIIIATSNAGSTDQGMKTVGFGTSLSDPTQQRSDLTKQLAPYFRPEFLNRFDEVIEFESLDKNQIEKITELLLSRVQTTLQNKGINLSIEKAVIEKLASDGFDPSMGARPLKRAIENELETPLANAYLKNISQKAFSAVLDKNKIIVK